LWVNLIDPGAGGARDFSEIGAYCRNATQTLRASHRYFMSRCPRSRVSLDRRNLVMQNVRIGAVEIEALLENFEISQIWR